MKQEDRLLYLMDDIANRLGGIGDAMASGVQHAFVNPLEQFVGFVEKLGVQLDPQRDQVYAWERNVIMPWMALRGQNDLISLTSCEHLIGRIFAAYGYPSPTVVQMPAGFGYADGTSKMIRIPPEMMRMETVLHEAAHGLSTLLAPYALGHSPEFVVLLCLLLKRYAGANRAWMLKTLEKYRIVCAKPKQLGLSWNQ